MSEPQEPFVAPRLHALGEVAEMLAVSESWLRAAVKRGQLEHIMVGHHIRFTEEQIQQIITTGHRPAIPQEET